MRSPESEESSSSDSPTKPSTQAPSPVEEAIMEAVEEASGKSSDNMIKLVSVIEDSDDIRATLQEFMWSSCKACHSKYRMPH